MEVIILMNKFIRFQICTNGSRQVNIFVLFFQTPFPATRKGGPLALVGSMNSVHLRSDKSLKAFGGCIAGGKRSTEDGKLINS